MTEAGIEPTTAAAARARTLRAGLVTSTVNRAVAAIVPLLLIPVALEQLGASGYGAWAAATSVTSLVAFADFGIGTGLMTRVAAIAHSDRQAARVLVSSAYAMIAAVVTALLLLLALAVASSNLGSVLGASRATGSNAIAVELIIALTLSAFVLNMGFSLVVRVQYAVGLQGRANLWQAAGSLAALGGAVLVSSADVGPKWFISAVAFIPVVFALFNTATFFRSSAGRDLAPRFQLASLAEARRLLALGSRFLAISVMMTASLALDPWIVARTSGLENVPDFAVPVRLFGFVGAVSVMLALPLWPLHAQAVASGDVPWIRRTTVRMTWFTTTVVALGCCILLTAGPHLIGPWLHDTVHADHLLWAGLAMWWVVQTATGPAFMVQNAAEVLGPQTWGYFLLLVTTLPAKWYVALHAGSSWIPWVGVTSYLLIILPACLLGYRRALLHASSRDDGRSA